MQKVARRARARAGSDAAPRAGAVARRRSSNTSRACSPNSRRPRPSFLEAALKLDPGYDRARLALWEVRTSQGDHAAALAAARAVGATSPDARRARFLAGVSLMSLNQNDEAFTVFKALQDAAPEPAILNNLGVIQLRRAAAADTGKPAYYFTKAAEAEPDDPDLLFNLGYAYALDRDPQGAIYWLREALRRNPGRRRRALRARRRRSTRRAARVEAGRERELAAQLSPLPVDAASARRDPLPRGLERVRQHLESVRGSGIDQAIANTAQRDQRDLAQFHLERARRLFEAEQDREAMMELRRAVFLSPYEAEAHLLIGRIHLRAGRPREAVDALKISIWSRDTAAAHVALADAYLRLKDLAAGEGPGAEGARAGSGLGRGQGAAGANRQGRGSVGLT